MWSRLKVLQLKKNVFENEIIWDDTESSGRICRPSRSQRKIRKNVKWLTLFLLKIFKYKISFVLCVQVVYMWAIRTFFCCHERHSSNCHCLLQKDFHGASCFVLVYFSKYDVCGISSRGMLQTIDDDKQSSVTGAPCYLCSSGNETADAPGHMQAIWASMFSVTSMCKLSKHIHPFMKSVT